MPDTKPGGAVRRTQSLAKSNAQVNANDKSPLQTARSHPPSEKLSPHTQGKASPMSRAFRDVSLKTLLSAAAGIALTRPPTARASRPGPRVGDITWP